ncbi:MAG: histidine phosphatase family protein [Nitrospinae bacterium]|nr:histidine phosphatase family protein [Nitrospinota bacterium]
MQATRIILVRHGETDWNAAGRLQGHRDRPLNAVGRAQAQRVAIHLAGGPVRAIYSSDLARSYETASIIDQTVRVGIVTSAALRERGYGIWEGLTPAEIQAGYPEQFAEWRSGRMDFAPAGGETRNQLLDRSLTELHTIARRHPGETVVVVTHGGLCYVVLAHIVGRGEGDRHAEETPQVAPTGNASLHILEVTGNRWSIVCMHETAHL